MNGSVRIIMEAGVVKDPTRFQALLPIVAPPDPRPVPPPSKWRSQLRVAEKVDSKVKAKERYHRQKMILARARKMGLI